MIRGSRVLVTGGAGTIGSHVVDLLVEAGASHVTVLDNLVRGSRCNLADAQQSGRVQLVAGDIRDRTLIDELTRGADLVFHLAALRITQCAEDPRLAHDVLATGALNVIEAASNARVRKVIASSSASVYGLATAFPTREDHHPWADDTVYGAAKTYNEGLLRSFHSMTGLPFVALRYFNVYGPRMDAHGRYTEVLIRWMERINAGDPPRIDGDGLQTMDFIDVRDIARANLQAAWSPITAGSYNVASGRETSLRDLARLLSIAMDRPDLMPVHGPTRRVNSVTRRLADTTAAERDLGFRARIPLSEGLRDLVSWWRQESSRGNMTSPLVTGVPTGS